MKTKNEFITINDNENKIVELLYDLVLNPRINALKWSAITKQTPNLKIGYPGQHLASLITGVEGARTGARGDDLIDGTEVKSCSRVDQLDTCKSCGNKVLRLEIKCHNCDSINIERKDDSKWLFSIKSLDELNLLTKSVNRVFLTLADYPDFLLNDFETIRIQAFEIWNNEKRHSQFKEIMTNYYDKLFLTHIKLNPNKTPAPKNFWPYSYQFYLCNPVKVFSALIKNANKNPKVEIELLIKPDYDRSLLVPEPMPTNILKLEEWQAVLENISEYNLKSQLIKGINLSDLNANKMDINYLSEKLPFLDEASRNFLRLRDTDKAVEAKGKYFRRK